MAKRTETQEQVQEPPREFHQLETFASFARRHGEYLVVGEGLETRPGIWNESLLFADGARAQSTHPTNYGGQEPSLHPVDNARERLAFAEEKLRLEKDAYDNFLKSCQEQAQSHAGCPDSCPPPPENWRDQLAAGEQRIDRWTKRVAELNDILNKLDSVLVEKRIRDEQREERRSKARKIIEELAVYPRVTR